MSANIPEDMQLHLNSEPFGYGLCTSIISRESLPYGKIYPFLAIGLGVLIAIYCIHMIVCSKKNKTCYGLGVINAISKYSYLLKQLVSRDFKTKYKRSFLGVLWSFLNPLLMMIVQYIVFSTLFQSSIKNFPLYLLSGIVCFNYFNEIASMCLTSIVDNSPLITKVYMPKYIYPLSKALSSTVNFFFSLIPLVGVMIITGAPVSKALLLFPIPVLCLFILGLGLGMFLAAVMVFFRDTRFLWGVISTVWMYLTPIIYPESILPEQFAPFFKFNPLYHIVAMVRSILIDGVSPDPMTLVWGILMSLAFLAVGTAVFKKTQDKFVLNL